MNTDSNILTNVEIIDNFLPESQFSVLQYMLLSTEFTWSYLDTIASSNDPAENYYFFHLFFQNMNHTSNFYNYIIPILEKLDPKALIRAKGNFYPNTNKFVEHPAHRDYEFPNKGAILYINDNNGYTWFEDGTKVASVANRLVKFDGSMIHGSTNCTDTHGRININFNYF